MPPEPHLALGAPSYAAEILDSLDALAPFVPAWSALADQSERATTFQRPEWVLSALRHLGDGPPRVVVVHHGSRLAGVLPLVVGPGDERIWSIAGTGPSDVLELIAHDGDAPQVAHAALTAVAARTDWSALELHELRHGSALAASARSGLAGRVTADGPCAWCPTVPIPERAHTLEDVVPPRWARRVRRDTRAAERAGLYVEVATPRTATEHLSAWMRLHTAAWRARGALGVVCGREAFFEDALGPLVLSGRAELLSLRDEDGELRASAATFLEPRRVAYYLGGFDPAIARRSPLVVLLGAVVERAAARGARELDFLRGAEPYKYRWGAVARIQHRVRVERLDA